MQRRLAGVMVVVALLALSLVPVHAQDGEQPDQAALVERVIAAQADSLVWPSFTAALVQSETLTFELVLGEQQQTLTQVIESTRAAQVVRADGVPNVNATLSGQVTDTVGSGDNAQSESYSVNIDYRWVDGVHYVQAAYVQPPPDGPELAEGWVVIADYEVHPVFKAFSLGDFEQQDSIWNDPEQLRQSVVSATIEPGTLEDGTPVDVIELNLGREGVLSVFENADGGDPETVNVMAENLSGESVVTLSVVLDGDGVMRVLAARMVLVTDWFDAALLMAQSAPEGMQMRVVSEMIGDQFYGDIGAEIEPVAPPDAVEPAE